MATSGQEIVNRATRERIVFRLTAADTAGELLEFDDYWAAGGRRTPAHVHPEMEERWLVVDGSAAFRVGERELVAQPGETVVAPPGVAHVAWNPTDATVHVRVQMRPALRWEEFTERLFALSSEGDPAPTALLALVREFPREIAPA